MQQASNSNIIRGVFAAPQVDTPVIERVEECPTCRFPLDSTAPGWVKDYSQHLHHEGHNRKFGYCEVLCLTCSGNALAKAQALEQARLVHRLFHGSDMPHRAENWTFSSYPVDADQRARAQVQGFVAQHLASPHTDRKRGLYICGLSGRCKTSLAISALKEAMKAGNIGLFVNSGKLLDMLRATFDEASQEKEHEIMSAMTGVPWLVLDDLGVERPTEYAIGRFYLIVNSRLDAGLYTIFTSNLSTNDLADYWRPRETPKGTAFHPGIRIVERIRSFCEGVDVQARKQARG